MELKVKIIDPIGLHARPASVMVQTANKFTSELVVKYNGKEANLKSIMSVMALGVKTNEEIIFVATGDDSETAIAEIKKAMEENKLI